MSSKGLKPREIVEKLNQHIIGQLDAKRAVAIALRNRWRRQNVTADLAEEISPKNIIMIGPTGVGKTVRARNHLPRTLGQSPPVWGKPSGYQSIPRAPRTIPTRVGKTILSIL